MPSVKPDKIGIFLGTSYLETAFVFADRAASVELTPPEDKFARRVLHESFVAMGIISSACALEVTINECFSFPPRNVGDKKVKQLLADLWARGIPRTAAYPVLEKYQIALPLAGFRPLDEGCEPYQSARSLIELRNWLVHYEPTLEPVYSVSGELPKAKVHKLYSRLKGKFPLDPLCASHAPFWPTKRLGSGCALWAAQASYELLRAFLSVCNPPSVARIDERITRVKQIIDAKKQLRQ
jgi:hypothetical protein